MLTKAQSTKTVDAFMNLLVTESFSSVTLRGVADEANVPLAKLVMTFSQKTELLDAFASRIDEIVLADDDPDMGDEPARERLFDVLMRRYDALLPYKLALIQLEKDARRDPALMLELARIASRSMRRMAVSADLDVEGARGGLVLTGLLRLHERTMRVFLAEEEGGQAKTMASLDTALRQAERRMRDIDRSVTLMRGEGGPTGGPLCRLRAAMDRRRDGESAGSANEDATTGQAA